MAALRELCGDAHAQRAHRIDRLTVHRLRVVLLKPDEQSSLRRSDDGRHRPQGIVKIETNDSRSNAQDGYTCLNGGDCFNDA